METKYVGIIGLITLLVGFGGAIILNPTEQNNAYYCEKTNTVGVFYGGISSTGVTAYPYSQNRTKYVRCDSGWVKMDIKSFDNQPSSNGESIQYRCNHINCTKIN